MQSDHAGHLPYSGHRLSVYPSAANLTASQAGTVRGTGPNFYLNKKSAWRLRPTLFSSAESIQPGWVRAKAEGRLPVCLEQGTLLAATTLQEGCTGPFGEGDSGPGQADVSICCLFPYLCLKEGSQACVRTRLILVCLPPTLPSRSSRVAPPSGQSLGTVWSCYHWCY